MAFLTHSATAASYGAAGVAPSDLPTPAGRDAIKLVRIGRAVEWLATHPDPNVNGLAAYLRVSRATAYRLLASPAFRLLLRREMEGRLTLMVRKAMDAVVETIENAPPTLRFRAAAWLIERFDKLQDVASGEADTGWKMAAARAEANSLLNELRARRQVAESEAVVTAVAPESGADVDVIDLGLVVRAGKSLERRLDAELVEGAVSVDDQEG
jgi:hypothetical protein